MKLKYVPLLLLFSLLALSSCTKNERASRHSAPQEPDASLTITIDTTWEGDTTIYLKP